MKDMQVKIYGDPVLRERSSRIDTFDKELEQLAESMMETMRTQSGIGLAAPQVGVSRQLIIALQMKDTDDVEALPMVLANPEITLRSRKSWSFEEGCLSVPGVTAAVIRPERIEVKYQDLEGNDQFLDASDMFARIIMHETDHLYGKLFIDYLSSAKKSLVKSKLRNLSHERHLF